jgi:hypothetical protein
MAETIEKNWVIVTEKYPTSIYTYPTETKAQSEEKARCLNNRGEIGKYEVMHFDEFLKRKADRLLTPIEEISEENYYYALEVLPPMNWGVHNGISSFFMSEFTDGNYTSQYAKRGGKYYCKTVNYYDKSTWINKQDFA